MKRAVSFLVAIGMVIAILAGCGYSSDRQCTYCHAVPTKKFTTVTETPCYVCKRCSTTCFFCDEPSSKHYTNGFDEEVFVCDECYDELSEYW